MEKLRQIFDKVDKKILIILLVAFVIFASNLIGGYFCSGDSTFHIAHLLAYIKTFNFTDLFGGSILPDLANNFGYGTRLFYPPLGYNLILVIFNIIKHFGFNIVLAIKLSYLLSVMLSGIFMYYFTKKVFKNNYVALLSAVFYMTMPYHILDIFFRDALSEIFIFAFVPLVFLGLEYLFEGNYKKFYLCFIGGYVFSMISHLVLSVYLTFFVVIYLLLNYKKVFNKKAILRLILSGVIILMFVSPFIIPMVEHKLFGNYMVFYPEFMTSGARVANTTLSLGQMFELPTANGELFYSFSYIAIVAFITVLCCGFKKIENKKVYKNITILLFICFIMLTPLFPWEKLPSLLLNIQFAWRLEVFFSFFIAVLGALVITLANKKNQKILTTVLACASVIFAIYLVNLHDYGTVDFEFVRNDGIGETWGMEYLPVKTYQNRDYFLSRSDDVIVKKGKADITKVNNATPFLEFNVKTEGATLELPRLYYLGYNITLDNKAISYYENKNGFIEIKIKNSGKVKVEYDGTIGYKIAIALFMIASGVTIIYFVFTLKKKNNM